MIVKLRTVRQPIIFCDFVEAARPEAFTFDDCVGLAKTLTRCITRGMISIEASSPQNAIDLLREHGVTVIRGALDRKTVHPLHDAMMSYLDRVKTRRDAGGDFSDFPARMNFNPKAYAADFLSLDPMTRGDPGASFSDSLLYKAVVSGPLRPILREILTDQAGWELARARIVFPSMLNDLTRGNLGFHQERIVSKYPGVHNVWAPFMPEGVIAGRNAAGLRFYMGDRHDWTEAAVTELNTKLDNSRVLQPEVHNGDVLVFDSLLPHASGTPQPNDMPRVAVDVRLFPMPDGGGAARLW